MENVLDSLPFDYSWPAARELRDLLATIYYRDDDIAAVADAIGFPRPDIPFKDTARGTWHEFLAQARARDVLVDLIDFVMSHSRSISYRDRIAELLADSPAVEIPADVAPTAVVTPDGIRHAEALTEGKSTLLDLGFLRGALRVAPAVVRIICHFANKTGHATGFLIGRKLVLTNHHVLFDAAENMTPVRTAEVWLGYENDPYGRPHSPQIVEASTRTMPGERHLDWAVLPLKSAAPEEFRPLPLAVGTALKRGDGVCIIQHARGLRKRVALQHNIVVSSSDDEVLYLTDTEDGSSGSPVFDEQWRVVALHSSCSLFRFEGERRLVNIGVPIRAVANGLRRHGIPFEIG